MKAARREFEVHGFGGASMRRIAASAGVATGTLFNYFEHKIDLLHQVLHGDLEEACAEAMRVEESDPIALQLEHMARVLLTMYARRPELSRVLLKESLFATGEGGGVFKAQVTRFAADVQRRVAAHGKPGPISPEVATLMFVSAYYFALIRCLASEPPDLEGALGLLGVQLRAILGGST